MNKLFTIILLLITLFCYSQEEEKLNFFFDENDKPIDDVDYYKKCNSFLYHCQQNENKTEIHNTIIELYKFGKLNEVENKQVRLLLSRNTKRELTNKTIIISYRELISGFDPQKKIDNSTSNNLKTDTKSAKLRFEISRKRTDQRQKKCIKQLKNKNVVALYLYNLNQGYTYNPEHFTWHKIPNVIKSLFFQKKSRSMLIIKPDGNYFRYANTTKSSVNKLINKDWKQYIEEYYIAKNSLQKNRIGFFKELNSFKSMPKFYIEKERNQNNRNTGRPNKKRKIQLPPGTIRVRNKADISKYLEQHSPCFSYPIF